MFEDDIPTRVMYPEEIQALRERMPRHRFNPDRIEVRTGGRIGELLRVVGESIVVMWDCGGVSTLRTGGYDQ